MLLGGSTYHSAFGINDHVDTQNDGSSVLSCLSGVDYVFFDEVSMLSAGDLVKISVRLKEVLGVPEKLFGGMNMIFTGDFAQLPPICGEGASLYGHFIGQKTTTKTAQDQALGKSLWHQVMNVMILRQNMRQREQSVEDGYLQTALENLRYNACTQKDLQFLDSRVTSMMKGRTSVTDKGFHNVSVITS